jgi:hypothetical protein
MVDELQLPPFLEWWGGAAENWLLAVACLAILGLLLGFVVAMVRYGPTEGLRRGWRVLWAGLADGLGISPRRVWALSWLAVKESIRRRVVVVFIVFILVLLFAGWFLDPSSTNPSRLYIDFVLTATSYLVLLLALVLSAFSLPTDIRNRTLFTVVTKPVRPSEIVLGRVCGFALIGTVLLALMCLVSYTFVVRGLAHTHVLRAEDVQRLEKAFAKPVADGKSPRTLRVFTTPVHGHSHSVDVDLSNRGDSSGAMQIPLNLEQGHWHELTCELPAPGEKTAGHLRQRIGPAEGALVARVPVYGKLQFRDREGLDTAEGINVGDEWTYRSYIQGGSQAAAIWTFQNLRPEDYSEEIPVEMNIGVFRTHKGNIEKGVLGSLSVRNPETGLTVEVEIFESKEFAINRLYLPRKIVKYSSKQVIPRRVKTPNGIVVSPSRDKLAPKQAEKAAFDFFDDFVADGKVEVWLRCLEPAQYFGVAERDLYVRASDASFEANFLKGYLGIWAQMVLVTCFGVMFSTFLSGPVAMIATLGIVVAGLFSSFMTDLAYGKTYGGGPVESIIRLFTQQNQITELDPGLTTTVAKMSDVVLLGFLRAIAAVIPAIGNFSYSAWVAEGFNVPTDVLLIHLATLLGFLAPLAVTGYFFLKTREVAR